MRKTQILETIKALDKHLKTKYVLCGSAALLMLGFLDREVSDIDIAISPENQKYLSPIMPEEDEEDEEDEEESISMDGINFDFDGLKVTGAIVEIEGVKVDIFIKPVTYGIIPYNDEVFCLIQALDHILKSKLQVMERLIVIGDYIKAEKHKQDFYHIFKKLAE